MGACGLVSDKQERSNFFRFGICTRRLAQVAVQLPAAGPATAERSAEHRPATFFVGMCLELSKPVDEKHKLQTKVTAPRSMPCCGAAWKPWMTFRQHGSKHGPQRRADAGHTQNLSFYVCMRDARLGRSILMETDRKRIQTVRKHPWNLLALASRGGASESTGLIEPFLVELGFPVPSLSDFQSKLPESYVLMRCCESQ